MFELIRLKESEIARELIVIVSAQALGWQLTGLHIECMGLFM
jgi:hypothetical protein